MRVFASLALVALSAAASAVPPVAGGLAQGRYRVVSERATLLEGRVSDAAGVARFSMEATLIGPQDAGILIGSMVELPTSAGGPDGLWQLEYELIGGYSRDAAGVLRFEAQLYLDLAHLGVPVPLHVGEMQGLLQTALVDRIQVQGGHCPGALPAQLRSIDQFEPVPDSIEHAASKKALEPVKRLAIQPALVQGTFRARCVLFD